MAAAVRHVSAPSRPKQPTSPGVLHFPRAFMPDNSVALSVRNTRFLELVDELVQEHNRVLASLDRTQNGQSEPPGPAGPAGPAGPLEVVVSQPNNEAVVREVSDEGETAEAEDECGSTGTKSQHSLTDFTLFPGWDTGAEEGSEKPQYRRQLTNVSRARSEESSRMHRKWWLISPDSPQRMVWELVGLLLLIYDLFRIPLLAFDPPKLLFFEIGDWISFAYWSLDIPATFMTGYYQGDGTMVWNIRKIGWRYAKTWLGLDLFVVGADWVTVLIEAMNTDPDQDNNLQALGVFRIGKVARLGRFFRIVRLARLAKLSNFLFMIQERVSSETASITMRVAKNMLLLLALNHLFACLWFWMGISGAPRDEKSWVTVYQLRGAEFSEQYVLSLHWTLTQFTPAGTNVQPQNLHERTFNVVLIVIAMISFSSFVSSITSSMTRLRMIQEDDIRAAFLLRKYLNQNDVSRALCSRIVRFIDLAKEMHRKRLHPSKVELLQLLSGPLRIELHYELYAPTLSMHTFFIEYGDTDHWALSELCFRATSGMAYSKGDYLFNLGVQAHSMYFITSGTVAYKHPKHEDGILRPRINLSMGKWACEASLWMPWVHRGTMITVIECDVVLLDGAKFREVTAARREAYIHSRSYAKDFLQELIGTREAYGYCWDVPVHMMLEKSTCSQRQLFSGPEYLDYGFELAHAEEVEAELMQSSQGSTRSFSALKLWQMSHKSHKSS